MLTCMMYRKHKYKLELFIIFIKQYYVGANI